MRLVAKKMNEFFRVTSLLESLIEAALEQKMAMLHQEK